MVKKTASTLNVKVSGLQHAWLNAMGVDVPWIARTTHSKHSLETVQDVIQEAVQDQVQQKVQSEQPAPTQNTPTPASTQTPRLTTLRLVSHQRLSDLNQQILSCQACTLCQARKQAVVGGGAEQPRILVVGEAPGEQEDRLGQAFVGRSGELLDNMLAAIGRSRHQDVYITHAVKCRTPRDRVPSEQEVATCAPYLFAQIATLKPALILLLGKSAAQALLGTTASLQELREQSLFFEMTHVVGQARGAGDSEPQQSEPPLKPIPVVVTLHPAFLLRRPADKRLAWQDLQKARDLLDLA